MIPSEEKCILFRSQVDCTGCIQSLIHAVPELSPEHKIFNGRKNSLDKDLCGTRGVIVQQVDVGHVFTAGLRYHYHKMFCKIFNFVTYEAHSPVASGDVQLLWPLWLDFLTTGQP